MYNRNYIGFDSPSIIRFFEPLTGDIFKACFEDFYFYENIFSSLKKRKVNAWNITRNYFEKPELSQFDSMTNQYELQVQKIIHLQNN
jgi:hypothetical protein